MRAIALALLIPALAVAAKKPEVLKLTGDLEGVHDPALMRQGGTYYLFVTNGRPSELIPIRCSPDLHAWKLCGHVFDKLPDWATREIPKARAPWAPDISFLPPRGNLWVTASLSEPSC